MSEQVTKKAAKVGIIMGSQSDLRVMGDAAEILEHFDVPHELTIVSAHRTPQRLFEYAGSAAERGLDVVIAGAGGAAHLPGMVASLTPLPVIGVPVKASISIDGWDSILSILQMPAGVPVATVAMDNARNAALLAVQILGTADPELRVKMATYKQALAAKVDTMIDRVDQEGWRAVRASL
ncbi:5-(carboxyamino)imidazole ribonucleotide mutase [Acanthopleuribacter pedis]|uniref:N5-carboxyaminoimidazole ribonucleotide mutase n=1 Tax=Acanthopleuribacter pedis TaxID=442870 RepID=A0A8J7Q903_9BACT|nr:5-(carboxyamino)imidazole ribonucleotide mutase [Acanthopleuribacter pedis]MBO1320791.1 5-(carboxyamino)imidazole ribonucleotide mutase [Acanthopleuribacter pedis]